MRHSSKSNYTSSTTASSSRSSSASHSYITGSSGTGNGGGGYDSRRLWAGRIAFLLTLVAVAITFGFLTYRMLTESENQLTEEQFLSIADRATCSAMQATERKRLGTQSLASVIGGANPNFEEWPNVVVNNYETISYNIIHTSKGCNMGFVPFVYPDQVQEFEDFIYDYYETSRMPEPWPNGTAIQKTSGEDWPDGKGIWSKDSDGNVFHDITGATSWNSSYKYLAPMIHHNGGASKKLLYNMHSIPSRGRLMDEMMECAMEKAAMNGSLDECVIVTPIIANKTSRVVKVENGPGAAMMQPIYPSNDPTKLVGVVMTGLVWAEIMESTYSDSVNGVDVVLSDGDSQYTYKIVDGQAYYEGEGDLHDVKFDSYGHVVDMTTPQFFGNTSSHYTLTLYPTQELYDVYSTPNPMIAAIGSICIIALTSVLFLLYDLSVRREFHAKKELLEAKRRFCRFVSHEVRTPLNSVCMGLTLMTEEMESSLAKVAQNKPETKPLFSIVPVDGPSTTAKQMNAEDVKSWLNLTEEVTANAYSAVNVLNEFLNYDKIQSNKLQLEYSVVPIFDLVQQTVAEFQIPASKKKINLQVLLPNDDSSSQLLVGDKVRLTMVVRNLISNSLKFTPEEGTITVRASWIPPTQKELKKKTRNKKSNGQMEFLLENQETVVCFPNGSFHLTVSDTGIGMTPDQIKTVFKQGSQFNVNQLQAGKGSGLGTWIAKGIIQQHGGLMKASSDGLHQGSTFTVNLPIHDIPSAASTNSNAGWKNSSFVSKNSSCVEPTVRSTADNSLEDDVAAAGDQAHTQETPTQAPQEQQVEEEEEEDPIGSLNILVVDDAKMNLKLLSRLLLKHGHTVTGAEDGDIAVERVQETMVEDDPESAAASQKKKFDLILMDYQMPRMTGPEAAKKIREMGSDAFLVGVTGNVMPEDIRVFKENGANAVLPKPIKIPDLENLLVEYGIRGEELDDDHEDDNLDVEV